MIAARETGAAMILAIILLLMMVSVSVFVAAAALTQSNTAKDQSLYKTFALASQNGIDWGMTLINSDVPFRSITPTIDAIPEDDPYYSSESTINGIGRVKFKVWAEKVAGANNTLSYYLYSAGYSVTYGSSKSVVTRAVVESISATKASYDTDLSTMNFILEPEAALSQGLFSNTSTVVLNSSKIYQQNSLLNGSYPTGTVKSTVSTNGYVQIPNVSTGIQRIIGGVPSGSTGCKTDTTCALAGAPSVTYTNTNTVLSATTVKDTACPASSYPNWVASENNGLLQTTNGSNVLCVGNMTFDTSTIVSGAFTAERPLTIYANGNIMVNNDVTVQINYGNTPQKLKIVTIGGNFTMNNGKANFLLMAESGACAVKNSSVFFGALACNTIQTQNSAKVYIDTASQALDNETSGQKMWFNVYQEEVEDNT